MSKTLRDDRSSLVSLFVERLRDFVAGVDGTSGNSKPLFESRRTERS